MQALEDLKVAALAVVAEVQEQARTVSITFKVSPAEAQQLAARCQGVRRSRYIRAKLFDGAVPRPRAVIPPVNRDVYLQTTYIRTNLNQIAKAINTASKSGSVLPLAPAVLEQLVQMNETLQQIRASLRANETLTDPDVEALDS